jgi:hypothetical protein
MRIFKEKDLTAMWNRPTLLRTEQNRTEQNRTEQNRTEQNRAWANCALFASCGALETEYYIRDG